MANNKRYLTAFINDSPTIREAAGTDITNAAHKAVMYNTDGDVVLATDASKAIGVVLSTAAAEDVGADLITRAGMQIDILVKYIGLIEVGGVLAKGDPITINANGQGVRAAATDFVFGWAFSNAGAAGELAHVQITRTGKIS